MDDMESEMVGHEVLLVDNRHDNPTRRSRSLFSNSIHAERYRSDRSEVRENSVNVTPSPIPVNNQAKVPHQKSNLVLITPTDHIEEAELIIRYAKHLVLDASNAKVDKRTKKEVLKVAQNFTQEAKTRALNKQAPSISLLSCNTRDSNVSKRQFPVDPNEKNVGRKSNQEDNSSSISERDEGKTNASEKNTHISASKPRGGNGVPADVYTKLPPIEENYQSEEDGESTDKYMAISESGKNAIASSNQEAHPKSNVLHLGRSRSSPWNPEQARLEQHKFVFEKDTRLHPCSSNETRKVTHTRKRLPRRAAAKHILLAHNLDRSNEKDDGSTISSLALPPRPNQGNRKYKTLLSQQPVLKTRSDLSVSSNSSEQRLAYIWGSKFHDDMLMSSSDEESDSSDDDDEESSNPMIALHNF